MKRLPALIFFALALTATGDAHAEVKELKAKQARQPITFDYSEASAAIAAHLPDCDGNRLAQSVECVAVIMDGPQGGAAAEEKDVFANVPVTPVLKMDDTGEKIRLSVSLTAETGGISHIDAFEPNVQATLRRDLFHAKRRLARFNRELSLAETEMLLVHHLPIAFEINDGWQSLILLEPVETKVTVNPPSVKFDTALGAAEGWLP